MTAGPPWPRRRPIRLPSASTSISSTRPFIASRTMARTASSRPGMPGASQSRFSRSKLMSFAMSLASQHTPLVISDRYESVPDYRPSCPFSPREDVTNFLCPRTSTSARLYTGWNSGVKVVRIYHSSRGRSAEITDRGLLYPILGVATVSAVILSTLFVSGNLPSPITIANLYLMGLGIGLVVARIGRLGPFEGILGSPWFESRVQETLARETARALRYDRDLTVVAIRPAPGQRLELQRSIRATDQLVRCRGGWNLLILPETDQASALFLL